jgi:dipeptidyl aminopeptidase/acylaminoacyl peptidase
VTDELVATTYEDDRTRYLLPRQGVRGRLRASSRASCRAGDRLRRLDRRRAPLDRERAQRRRPGETYLFDREDEDSPLQYRIRERLPREHMAPMTSIRYKSSDGLEIPAYLTSRRASPRRTCPLVLFPHGGPWARDNWGYNPYAQFLANRGYAVLQPNFRGSTGYGKKFLNAGNKAVGRRCRTTSRGA